MIIFSFFSSKHEKQLFSKQLKPFTEAAQFDFFGSAVDVSLLIPGVFLIKS